MQETNCDIGLIGLAVMGQNLVLNMNDHGYRVAVFNRTVAKVDEFIADQAKGTQVVGCHSVEELCGRLKRPRRVMLMVKAGQVVDQTIDTLLPHLERGDIIIDGGNSLFTDSERRAKELLAKGILYVGSGVSGGEEGARHGPSIMPGGNPDAWPHVKDILRSIAAKALDGSPCCDWIGEGGAGHYVKMVHNGIEYGDMQLIGEAYQLLKDGLASRPGSSPLFSPNGTRGNWTVFSSKLRRRFLRRRTPTDRPSSTRYWTRPARRARASGPQSRPSTSGCR